MGTLLFSERFCSVVGTVPGRRRRCGGPALGVFLALALAGAVCFAAEPPDSPDSIVVALDSVDGLDGLDDSAALAARIESMVSDVLRGGGFAVVPSDEFAPAWRDGVREANGYYDLVTGRPDLAKRRALRAAALRSLHERHRARVVLQPALVVVAAEYAKGKAQWDGAKETAAPTGSGEVPALSFAVLVEDLDGREIAVARAGIQLLAKYSKWTAKYGPVPPEKLLADEQQLREAVGRAVTSVLDAIREAPAGGEIVEDLGGAEAAGEEEAAIEPPPEGARVAALRALLLPGEDVPVPTEVASRYAEHLRARLEEAGWWVLPADAFERTLRAIVLERGGIYDPITGQGDSSKLTAAIEETRRQLAARYGASAFVMAGIVVRPARITGEKASWDGVEEQVADIAAWKKLLVVTRGTTEALSFGVAVEDVDGTELHSGWGGIQLKDRLERGRFVAVPAGELFADPERDRRAVDLALGDWRGPDPG